MELAPVTLLYEDTCPHELRNEVTKKIRQFYFGDKKIDETTRSNLIDVSFSPYAVFLYEKLNRPMDIQQK